MPRLAAHVPSGEAGTGPLVSFARSGVAAQWQPSAYQSLACAAPS